MPCVHAHEPRSAYGILRANGNLKSKWPQGKTLDSSPWLPQLSDEVSKTATAFFRQHFWYLLDPVIRVLPNSIETDPNPARYGPSLCTEARICWTIVQEGLRQPIEPPKEPGRTRNGPRSARILKPSKTKAPGGPEGDNCCWKGPTENLNRPRSHSLSWQDAHQPHMLPTPTPKQATMAPFFPAMIVRQVGPIKHLLWRKQVFMIASRHAVTI